MQEETEVWKHGAMCPVNTAGECRDSAMARPPVLTPAPLFSFSAMVFCPPQAPPATVGWPDAPSETGQGRCFLTCSNWDVWSAYTMVTWSFLQVSLDFLWKNGHGGEGGRQTGNLMHTYSHRGYRFQIPNVSHMHPILPVGLTTISCWQGL